MTAFDRDRNLVGTVLAGLLAVAAGLGIAWVDVRSDEIVVALVPLLICRAMLGLARPRWAWLWGVLLGMWIPIAHWTGVLGAPIAPANDLFSPLLPLIPSTLAALAAAGVERGFEALLEEKA
jgi:hypothetical protein